ncbi:MAG: DUF2800 domain-containing protein [Gammaproteobacteria bacterium PRO9]|nr:DUF2800 domain-containing protein [Gammaproteobacteria bacterium PRO9]
MSEANRPAHSEWGASGAHRWMACAGSIRLSRGAKPGKSSFYADEGTVAHAIGEQCLLNSDRNPVDFIGQTLKGQDHDIQVTEEMADAVALYVQTVRTDKLLLQGELWVEHSFDISPLTKGIRLPDGTSPPLYGRNDCCLFDKKEGHLIVYDYKHGAGHAVDVEMNPQLLYYALGAVLENDKKRKHRIRSIEIAVIQPRAPHKDGPVRRFPILLVDLLEWAANLVEAVKRTVASDAPLTAGEHCLFCPAAPVCPELHKQAQETAMTDFRQLQSQPPAPETLTMQQLCGVMAKASLVEGFIKAVRDHLHGLASSGVLVPGWKLVPKRATRKWAGDDNDTAAALHRLAENLTLEDLYTEPALKSPAQVEALLKKAKVLKDADAKATFESLYTKESSGTTLAPDDDARIGMAPPAVTDFAHLRKAG